MRKAYTSPHPASRTGWGSGPYLDDATTATWGPMHTTAHPALLKGRSGSSAGPSRQMRWLM
eukprot:1702737-Pyramimonas_sp.AAC.1